jgi:azurin
MKIRITLVSLFAALLAAGCGKNDTATTSTASSSAPAAAPAAPAPAAGPQVFELTANDQMKFVWNGKETSPAAGLTIEAKAGDVKLVLTNAGTMPKEAMGHNLVVLKPGSDVMAFSTAAAAAGAAKDYIPDALKDEVLGHTAILGPRKSDEVNLKGLAPGEYPFLCSFPAHAQVGMKGVLVVK